MKKIPITWLVDIREMPNFSSAVTNGIDSVSKGKVFWTDSNKVTCKTHKAMLCVSEDRRIWRCPACNEGGYIAGVWGSSDIKIDDKKWYQFWKV